MLSFRSFFFFLTSKTLFCYFQLFAHGHIHKVVSTLINVVKLDVEKNIVVLTLSNVVNINVEIDNVDSTMFNIVNFNVENTTLFQRLFDVV